MPAAYVNRTAAESVSAVANLSAPAISHTAGNLLVVLVSVQSAGVAVTISDTALNTWHQAGTTFVDGSNTNYLSIFYAYNINGNASNIVKATLASGTASYFEVIAYQFSGFGANNPFGSQVATAGNNTAPTSQTLNISGNSSVIVALIESDAGSGLSQGTGFSGVASASGYFLDEYKVVSASQTATANSTTDPWRITAAIFNTLGPQPSVSDTTTMSDSPNLEIISYINVSDTTVVSDIAGRPDDTVFTFDVVQITQVYDFSVGDGTDTTIISEYVNLEIISYIPVSDTTTVTDTPTVVIISPGFNPNVSDNTAITEYVNLELISYITVGDSTDTTVISESVNLEEIDQGIVVSDTTVVNDLPALELFSYISVSDTTNMTDSPALEIFSYINVSDTTVISDAVYLEEIEQGVVVSDTTIVSDSPNLEIISYVNVSDTTVTTDASDLEIICFLSVSDTTVMSDGDVLELTSYISVSDTTIVSDNGILKMISYALVSDTTIISDVPNLIITVLYFEVSDSTVMSDTCTMEDIEQGVVVNDLTIISDEPNLEITSYISVSDTTVVSDLDIVIIYNLILSVSDTTVISENVENFIPVIFVTNDTTVISENVQLRVEIIAFSTLAGSTTLERVAQNTVGGTITLDRGRPGPVIDIETIRIPSGTDELITVRIPDVVEETISIRIPNQPSSPVTVRTPSPTNVNVTVRIPGSVQDLIIIEDNF